MDKIAEEFKVSLTNPNNEHLQLVSNQQIQLQLQQIAYLKQTKARLKSQQASQLQKQINNYQTLISQLSQKYQKQLHQAVQKLQSSKKTQKEKVQIQQRQILHLKLQLDSEYQEKQTMFQLSLNEQFRKFDELKEQTEDIKVKFDHQFSSIMTAHQTRLKQLEKVFQVELQQIKTSYQAIKKKIAVQTLEYEKQLNLLQDQHQSELMKIKQVREKQVIKQVTTAKQVTLLAVSQENTKQGLVDQKQVLEKEKSQLEQKHKSLTQQVDNLRKILLKTQQQLQQRNEVILRKQSTIKQLQSFNIHLQNFHFVLNQKIEALTQEREPIDRYIKEKQQNLRKMFEQHREQFTINKNLVEKIKKTKQKMHAVDQLNRQLKSKIYSSQKKTTLIQSDMAELVRNVSIKQLRPQLYKLIQKHLNSSTVLISDAEMSNKNIKETLVEANIQKAHQEIFQQHAAIREKLQAIERHKKMNQKKKDENLYRKMYENDFLIRECNTLKNQRQQLIKQVTLLQREMNKLNNTQPVRDRPVLSKTPQMRSLGNLNDKLPEMTGMINHLHSNKEKLLQQNKALKKIESKINWYSREN